MCDKIPKKELFIFALMFVFSRGMVFLSKRDQVFKRYIARLPEGFKFSFFVKPRGPSVSFCVSNSVLREYRGDESDLKFMFKNPCSAFLVFSGIMSQHLAFAEHRISLKGDISMAVLVTRAVERLQAVIFPDFVLRRLLKEFSGSSISDKLMFLKFYSYGLPFSGGRYVL